MNSRFSLVMLCVTLAMLFALALIAYLGTSVRYMSDDYCYTAVAHRLGFQEAQAHWYTTWSGRFSFTFIISALAFLGSWITPFLPTLALVLWLIAIVWTVYQCMKPMISRPFLPAVLLGSLVLFVTLASAHSLVQSLYWQTGMLTYSLPLILLTWSIGIIILCLRDPQPYRRYRSSIIVGLLACIAGGLSDAYAVFQVALFGIIITSAFISPLLRQRSLLVAAGGVCGALLALGVVLAAPGNAIRQSFFEDLGLVQRISRTLVYAAGFLPVSIARAPFHALFSFLLPAVIAFGYQQRGELPSWRNRQLLYIALYTAAVTGLLLIACALPAVVVTGNFLPPRARIIPQYVVTIATVVLGCLTGIALAKTLRSSLRLKRAELVGWLCVALLVVLSPLRTAQQTLALVPQARESAMQWDRMDQQLQVAHLQGQTDVTIPAMLSMEQSLGSPWTEMQLEPDPGNWKNGCAASYYGLISVRTEQ